MPEHGRNVIGISLWRDGFISFNRLKYKHFKTVLPVLVSIPMAEAVAWTPRDQTNFLAYFLHF